MLSHRNLAWTAETLIRTQGGEENDRGLSYLPLSHIAEQMCSIHVPAASGAAVYFAESIEKVPDNIKRSSPRCSSACSTSLSLCWTRNGVISIESTIPATQARCSGSATQFVLYRQRQNNKGEFASLPA